eukprot:g13420.t1
MAKSMGLMAAAASAAYLCREAFVPSSGATEAPASPALLRGAERVGQRSTSGGTVLPSLCGAALVASAASSLKRRKAACKAFENEMGATLPFKYFDPLGMAKDRPSFDGFTDGDQETFRRRRIAEIKNGRVAMMACMGYIAPEYFRWPGYCSPSTGLGALHVHMLPRKKNAQQLRARAVLAGRFGAFADLKFADIPNGTQALYKMPAEAWAQIACFIGFLELFPMRQEKDRIPGDAPGFGKLGLPFATKADPEKNCRWDECILMYEHIDGVRAVSALLAKAMVAITGMISQNAFFGTTGPDMWLPGASAFEGELGVQAPVGYWDPLGLSADGDVEAFKRRRAVELKHGRICMLATIGYIVPEYFRWPGYLSPEKGLKFADMPHGIAAVSKVPLEGWGPGRLRRLRLLGRWQELHLQLRAH